MIQYKAFNGILPICQEEEEWAKVESFELANEAELKFWNMPDAGCC